MCRDKFHEFAVHLLDGCAVSGVQGPAGTPMSFEAAPTKP
jgi:hypothetical protein